jgi:hypothetical protein
MIWHLQVGGVLVYKVQMAYQSLLTVEGQEEMVLPALLYLEPNIHFPQCLGQLTPTSLSMH